MKKILTIIVFVTSWIYANAQVPYDSIDIKKDNSYQYICQFNSSAKDKYEVATNWLDSSINEYERTIISENKRSFKVKFKPEIMYEQSDAQSLHLVATITLECHDDKILVRFTDIKRKSITPNCNFLTPASEIYKKRNYNANQEMQNFSHYKELSVKKRLTSEESSKLNNLKHYKGMTKEMIMKKEMKPYIDLQKAIASLINGIEKAIKGE